VRWTGPGSSSPGSCHPTADRDHRGGLEAGLLRQATRAHGAVGAPGIEPGKVAPSNVNASESRTRDGHEEHRPAGQVRRGDPGLRGGHVAPIISRTVLALLTRVTRRKDAERWHAAQTASPGPVTSVRAPTPTARPAGSRRRGRGPHVGGRSASRRPRAGRRASREPSTASSRRRPAPHRSARTRRCTPSARRC
jgi:hypothetical protein